MSVKVTLEFGSLTDASNFLLTASGSVSGDGTLIVAPAETEAPAKKTRKTAEKPAAAPAATVTQAPVAAAAVVAAPAGGVELNDAYLKALTESVLAVAAEVDRDSALALLAQYKMADGATPVKQCSALPKEAWVAVKTAADEILTRVRAVKAAATAAPTSLI